MDRPLSRHDMPLTRDTMRRGVLAAILSFLVSSLFLALGGCATGPQVLRAQVTTFHEWPGEVDKTYVFLRPVGVRDSLEQKTYEEMVAQELARVGFVRAASVDAARLGVTVRARIVPETHYVVEPAYDPFFFDPFWRGPWGPAWYPGWGGYRQYPVTFYKRSLTVEIDDLRAPGPTGKPPKRVWEGTVVSTGGSESLPAVMPYLARALFSEFPGGNGKTRVVSVPVDQPVSRK